MLTFRGTMEGPGKRSFFSVDSLARNAMTDPVGAGDALLAYATLTQIATGNEVISSIIGTIAAGIECEFEGNVPVSPDLVSRRLRELETASDFA
jgi:sugar/nucleoside kinase (ribokinase family)